MLDRPAQPKRKPLRFLWVLCAGLLTLSWPAASTAQPPASDTRVNDAKKLFAKGTDLFLAKRYADALEALRASYKFVPSPNSGLLIARCLRELGQLVEAQEMFAAVEADARKREADGEKKYARTAEAAAAEGAATR